VTVTGTLQCEDRGNVVRPLSGARVHVRERLLFGFSDRITRTYTQPDGSFSMSFRAGEYGHPRFFVRVYLKSPEDVTLRDWWMVDEFWSLDLASARTRTARGVHRTSLDYGVRTISKNGGRETPKCAIWQGARHAWNGYVSAIGADPPMRGGYEIVADTFCCGSPWTTRTATYWPPGERTRHVEDPPGDPIVGDYRTSWHEFGHVFRHWLDGSGPHFLGDVARYGYARNHENCLDSNLGFAFNEGWAKYWAWDNGGCARNPEPLTVEGNVARELKCLEDQSDRPTMVRVLRENRGTIHSYAEFEARWEAIVGRPASTDCTVTTAGPPVDDEIAPIKQLRDYVKEQLGLLSGYVQRLRREEAGIRPVRPGAGCGHGDCTDLLQRVVRPIGLRARTEQAKLIESALRAALRYLEKRGYRFGPDRVLQAELARLQRDVGKRNLSMLARRYDLAIARLEPFRRRHAAIRRELSELRTKATRIATLRRRNAISSEELGLPPIPGEERVSSR
jgi:hypothetical protein